jgi:hypothetical protein
MPEPYPFPRLPGEFCTIRFLNKRLQPVQLGFAGDIPVVMTPPIKATNFISFFFKGETEVFRWALVTDDSGKVVPITEDGKVTPMNELVKIAFRIAMGTEAYERFDMEKTIESNSELAK